MNEMEKRKCCHCSKRIPSNTEHFIIQGQTYCTECVEVREYTAYQYLVGGEYMGDSESDDTEHIESYEDDYEENIEV